jgi:ABC-type thiamine transport system ATPase subunit
MITTVLPISSGRVTVFEQDVALAPDRARLAIGVIPQAMTSDTELTVEENLSIYAKLYGVKRAARRSAINELLEIVGLTQWRNAEVHTLSGGMRRRVEVARGLVHSPKILFLDEPTTGLLFRRLRHDSAVRPAFKLIQNSSTFGLVDDLGENVTLRIIWHRILRADLANRRLPRSDSWTRSFRSPPAEACARLPAAIARKTVSLNLPLAY